MEIVKYYVKDSHNFHYLITMAYRRTYRKKRTYKRRTYKRKSYARRPTVAMKKYVKREISRNVENKTAQYFNIQQAFYYPASSGLIQENTLEMCLSPTCLQIPQGAGQGNRIGNKIKVKKLVMKGTLNARGYDVSSNPNPKPQQVRCVLFYDKTDPNDLPAPAGDFFQLGSTSTGIIGELTDMWAPINTDRYRVLAQKYFKLGYSQYGGTNFNADAQAFSNNDFKYNCNIRWDLTKYYPKLVTFRDGNTDPSNRALYMQVIVVPADGTTGVSGVIPINGQYMLSVQYEDA